MMKDIRQYIDKVLGSSIRCLLPSYWWKRIFGLIVDEVEDVRKVANNKADKSSLNSIGNRVRDLEENSKEVSERVDEVYEKTERVVPHYTLYAPRDSSYTLTEEQEQHNKISVAGIGRGDSYPSNEYTMQVYLVAEGLSKKVAVNSLETVMGNLDICVNDPSKTNILEGGKKIRFAYDGSCSVTDVKPDAELNGASEAAIQNKAVYNALTTKQDRIDDLETIRTNASKGATAIQSVKTINGQSIIGEGDITIEGGSEITIDSELSETSENPVQNKVVTETLNDKADISYVDEQITDLTNEMIANEEVHASAYNDLNTRLNELSENVHGETITKEEFQNLQNEVIANEEVAASAINDLNTRLAALEAVIANL